MVYCAYKLHNPIVHLLGPRVRVRSKVGPQDLHESSPETVPHPLPDQYALVALISDLPLRLVQYIDLPDLYLAVLQVRLIGFVCPTVIWHASKGGDHVTAALGHALSYCALLTVYSCRQVPPGYLLQAGPRRLAGAVTTGFGRGSTQMGVPTANLPPEPLVDILKDLPSGVYFGCGSQMISSWSVCVENTATVSLLLKNQL